MKTIKLLTGVFLLLFATSCRDAVNTILDSLDPFQVPFNSTLDVPFATVSTTEYFTTPELPMNIDLASEIKKVYSNASVSNLKSVNLSLLKITYVSSNLGNKLDVIKNAQIYIKSPNLPDKLIAEVTNNTNPTEISFQMSEADIADYFRTNKNSLIIKIMGSRASADQIKMDLRTAFKIRVQL